MAEDPVITGLALEDKPRQILIAILKAAGLSAAKVTSVQRNAAEQARVMYDNLQQFGVAAQNKLYAAPGRAVIQVFAANQAKPRDEVIQLMTDKINQLGPSTVSHHASNTHFVFDVAPSSISNKAAFIAAVKANASVSKFLQPPNDPAFHIEIPKQA
ncbi:MAG: hypothetical protein M3O35_17910 [Acidobacteriota bacterium]|nr:hypothetical protein [Acidobacteriota bacterium]